MLRKEVESTLKLIDMMSCSVSGKTAPVIFHPVQRETIDLLSKEDASAQRLVIFYPSRPPDLPAALVLFLTYIFYDKGAILLAGEDVSKYRDLYIGTTINGTPLSDLLGLATIGKHGTIKSVTQKRPEYRTSQNRVIMVGNLSPPDLQQQVDTLIIIAPSNYYSLENLSYLLNWSKDKQVSNVIVIDYLPENRRMGFYAKNGFKFKSWSKTSIQKMHLESSTDLASPYEFSLKDLEDYCKESAKVTKILDFQRADKVLSELHSINLSIDKEAKYNRNNNYLNAVKSALPDFIRRVETAVSPLGMSEDYYKNTPFHFKTSEIVKLLDTPEAPQISNRLSTAHALAESLMESIATVDLPKTSYIINAIGEAESKHQTLLVVCCCKRESYLGMLELFAKRAFPLDTKELENKGIRIAYFKDLPQNMPANNFDLCIFSSYPTHEFGWLLFKYFAPRLEILSYKSEAETISAIEEDYGYLQKLAEAQEATKAMYPKHITIETLLEESADKYAYEGKEILEEGGKATAKGIEASTPGYRVSIRGTEDDDHQICLKKSSYVQIFREPNEVTHVRAERLKEGNILVLINDSIKFSLTDIILKKARENPDMLSLEAAASFWLMRLHEDMAIHKDTPKDLLLKMRGEGSTLKSHSAVYFWKRGWVIGPQDINNIKIIAKVYSDSELLAKVDETYAAIKKVRNIRLRLVLYLRSLLLNRAYDERLAEDWNIYPEDFGNVKLYKVQSIDWAEGIPLRQIGKVM